MRWPPERPASAWAIHKRHQNVGGMRDSKDMSEPDAVWTPGMDLTLDSIFEWGVVQIRAIVVVADDIEDPESGETTDGLTILYTRTPANIPDEYKNADGYVREPWAFQLQVQGLDDLGTEYSDSGGSSGPDWSERDIEPTPPTSSARWIDFTFTSVKNRETGPRFTLRVNLPLPRITGEEWRKLVQPFESQR